MLRPAAAAVAVAALAAGFASSSNVGTGTVACSTRVFEVSFDPARRVVVTSGGKVLASATFTARSFGGTCRRIAEPRAFVDAGVGAALRSATGFRCVAPAPIRIHASTILQGGKPVGSLLLVGTGSPLRYIVRAVLKQGGQRRTVAISRARAYCKLGAR